jgi:ribonuclease T2
LIGYRALTAFLLILVVQPAAAQSLWERLTHGPPQTTPCVLDKCLGGGGSTPAPRSAPTAQAPASSSNVASGDFDFYVLALSWSSGFCEAGGRSRPSQQCDIGSGLGFVVHGLWPQNDHGFPSDCGNDRPVSQIAMNEAKGLFPDDGLARYEWRKHGTCSGKSPQAYFADVRRARDSITIPPDLQHPQQDLTGTAHDLVTDFLSSNAGLRPEMMAIGCKGGILQEVRICLSKDLRSFHTCAEVSRDTCRASQIQVPHVR